MKSKKFFVFLPFLLCGYFVTADVVIDFSSLPNAVEEYLEDFFNERKIFRVEKDFSTYEVKFEDGFEVEFDHKGKIKKIDGGINEISVSLLPDEVVSFISKGKYEGMKVTKWERKRHKHEVEFNGGEYEVELDNRGRLIKEEWDD